MDAYLVNTCYLIILFFSISVLGWCMEVILKYVQYKRFINRGFLIGPYLPIYGSGVVFIVIVCDFVSKYDNSKVAVFLTSFIICGLWEYTVSFILEKIFQARWWDYSKKPMNLNGRVWIGNLILFGIGGLIVNEVINPLYKNIIVRIPQTAQYVICGIIVATLCIDYAFSHFILKVIKNGIDNSEADNTEAITNEIRILLSDKNILYRRILEAYPEIIYRTDRIKKRLEEIKQETERIKGEIEHKRIEVEEKIAELKDNVQIKKKPLDNIAQVKPGNVFDYIKWRGDISIKNAPFNEIDNLILSQLSYIKFDGVIVEDTIESAKTIEEISKEFFDKVDLKEYLDCRLMTKNAVFLLREMAKTVRFKDAKMFSYVNDVCEADDLQFSAVTIYLGDNLVYVSFSGTDSSIVGWHEDFNMSYLEKTAGQIKAKHYIENLKLSPDMELLLGGHSKGGNLAISAALSCNSEIESRIKKIYNNDGPGFLKEVINSPEYMKLLPKIHSVMPTGSIVGTLLEHGEQFKYIGSTNFGVMEHDALSWQVLGPEFYEKDEPSKHIVKLDSQVRQWLEGMSNEERKDFVNNIFFVLDMAEIKTIDDFTADKMMSAFILMLKEKNIRAEYKARLSEILKVIINIVK